MESLKPHQALLRTTLRHGAAHLLAVLICTATVLLFVALSFSHSTLPHYATNYTQKDTQQVVNLIITVVATLITILFSQCRRFTNEAETKSELRDATLTIPRLHVHIEAAGGSHAAMGMPALHNKQVWRLVAFYMFVIVTFGFINSVLSVIFVIESVISENGIQSPAYIPLGVDVPYKWEGKVVDPCDKAIAQPGCSYDLAITALSSQLINYAPYTVGGVTFEPPNGTMGLPYWAMQHFSDQVESSRFEEERRSYCLPVLDPNIIHCTEEPFDQQLGRTNSSLVRYEGVRNKQDNDADMCKIFVPANTESWNVKYRTSDQGLGVMLVRMYPEVIHNNITVITTMDSADPAPNGAYHDGYASLLYYLMYGVWPDASFKPTNSSFHFVAKCEWQSIKYRDNYRSSWRKVEFTLKNGVSRANITDELCPNPRAPMSGFDDLYFDLEGTADVLSSTDGYCKLFNNNKDNSTGTDIFTGMSRLDAIVNKMLHVASTAWSQENYEYAIQVKHVHDNPVIMTDYPHLYVIRINWTPTTYIGLILAVLITLNAYAIAARWARATLRLGGAEETWNLLQPVDLMAFTLAAYQDLVYRLNTKEHRRMAMRGEVSSVLRDRPLWQGTQSLISLMGWAESNASSPISPTSDKDGGAGGAEVNVLVRERGQPPG